MKIAFIIPKISYSGAPKIMAWVANGMVSRGHSVTIIAIYGSKCEQFLDKKVRVVFLRGKQNRNWFIRNTVGLISAVRSCRKTIKKMKPDAIISFLDSMSYVYILMNKLFWRDTIISSERVDPCSRHGFNAFMNYKAIKRSDLIVFQTGEAEEYYKKKNHKLNSCVIPNPVIVNAVMKEAIKRRKETVLDKEKMKIVSVGRLSITQKRQDVLLKALSELRKNNISFIAYIYGAGEDEDKVKKMIRDCSLEKNVLLMGQQDNVLLKIFDSNCFVLTSDFEGIPNALMEAMSIGIPCISTDCSPGGARLLITDGENGFIVDRGDYLKIAERIMWVGSHKCESEIIGNNATAITKKFSEEKVMDLWENEIKHMGENKNV